ncbi:AAA-ATPase At2g46620-like [Fagus crenata]
MFLVFLFVIISFLVLLRFLFKTSIIHIFLKRCRSIEDWFHSYQSYKIPQYNEHYQENQLYRKISIYLNSLLATIDDDSDFTNLFSGSNKTNDILLHFDSNQIVHDKFFSARVSWTNENSEKDANSRRSFVLRIRKNDKRRVLRQYLQHILTVVDEIEQNKKEIKFLSHAEISEIMISNRNSPSRALKSVITALQTNGGISGQRLSESGSRREESSEPPASVFCRESVHTVREFRKLYGLLKMGSRRKDSVDLDSAEKEGSRHGVSN